ncbi:MAG: UpxY family transcription antiterminator [Candidatus Acidiferrum sp.]
MIQTATHFSTLAQTEPTLPMVPQSHFEGREVRWFAAYTSANHEKRVAQQAERQSLQCFLPLYESVRRWKDRRVRLALPLFPGYVFVRLNLRDRLKLLEISGVARLVGFDGHPAPVPDEDIETIRACLAGRYPMQPHRYLQRGQRVRVLSGPLAGLTGIVVRQKKHTRFVISLDLLMRSVAVELDTSDFDPYTTSHA